MSLEEIVTALTMTAPGVEWHVATVRDRATRTKVEITAIFPDGSHAGPVLTGPLPRSLFNAVLRLSAVASRMVGHWIDGES